MSASIPTESNRGKLVVGDATYEYWPIHNMPSAGAKAALRNVTWIVLTPEGKRFSTLTISAGASPIDIAAAVGDFVRTVLGR